MVFSTRNILAGLATGLLAVRGVRADDCDENAGPFQETSHFGKQGYNPSTGFCHTKWTAGLIVTGMEVWGTNYHVSGVRFTYSDSSIGPVQGATNFGNNKQEDNQQGGDKKHDFITWTTKDQITNFKAATSKDGKALGLIHIEVAGKTLTVGQDNVGDGTEVNIGSGVLLGASGETNNFPSYWTPLFLAISDGNAEITEMKFDKSLDDVNKQQDGISSVVLADVYLKNTNTASGNSSDNSQSQSYSFTGSQSVTSSTSLTTTNTNTFGLSVSLEVGGEVGLPLVAEGSTKLTTTASYDYSTSTAKGTSSSDQHTIGWNLGSSASGDLVKPGHAKHCKATIISGHYNGGYTSTVSMTVKGKPFTFQQRGTFDSISYSNVDQSCEDVLIKDIPSGANSTDASSTVKDGKRAVFLRA